MPHRKNKLSEDRDYISQAASQQMLGLEQMVGNNQMFEPAHDMNERVGTGYSSLVDGELSDNLNTQVKGQN